MTAGEETAGRGSPLDPPAVASVMTPWKYRGLEAIRRVLDEKGTVTSDDIHSEIGDPPGDPNMMGALFRDAAKAGITEFSGRLTKSSRPSAKRRDIKVWVKSETRQGSLIA